jgi:hypothetical protein
MWFDRFVPLMTVNTKIYFGNVTPCSLIYMVIILFQRRANFENFENDHDNNFLDCNATQFSASQPALFQYAGELFCLILMLKMVVIVSSKMVNFYRNTWQSNLSIYDN